MVVQYVLLKKRFVCLDGVSSLFCEDSSLSLFISGLKLFRNYEKTYLEKMQVYSDVNEKFEFEEILIIFLRFRLSLMKIN